MPRPTVLTRIAGCLSAALAATLLFSNSALATPGAGSSAPPRSAYTNLVQQMASVRAGEAVPSTNGVPVVSAATSVFPATGTECGAPGYILSKYNGLYVSTELGYGGSLYGMLRARSATLGAWEYYQLCYNPATAHWAIWADANKKWVSAELGYPGNQYGMLRARSSSVGPWELFIPYSADQVLELESAANRRWVSAEFGDPGAEYGMLRARSFEIGEWELYWSDLA